MQRHEVSFTVDAPVERVWNFLHPTPPPDAVVPRTFDYPGGTITILRDGDHDGAGLVRKTTFAVPKWLLSGGVARSWEVVTAAKRNEFAEYDAVGKPLWSTAGGSHRLEAVDDGARTRLTFVETYHAYNPLVRVLFEARVHRFISRNNTRTYKTVLGYLGTVSKNSSH